MPDNNNRLIELLIKKESENLTLLERKELLKLLEEDESYLDLVHFLDVADKKEEVFFNKNKQEDVEKSIQRLKKKINVKTRRLPVKKYLLVAASVLAAFVFIKFMAFEADTKKLAGNTYKTEKGSKSNLTLPDGSKIWINSDTKISYKDDFGKTSREIFLEGEAYFDIVKDVSKPFIVHTSNMNIKVLGTVFNVRAYNDESNTQASLIKGSIEVTLTKDKSKIIRLKPNEKIILRNNVHKKAQGKNADEPAILITNIKRLEADSSVVETLWIENKLAFREESLENIILLLKHWYNVEIIIADASLKNNLYSGTFKGDNITDVMNALSLTGDFSYSKKNDTIFIIPK